MIYSAAEVTIRMKNEGHDAINPDVYGKSIIITRHFSITGASGFKIKSSLNPGKNGEGRVIATSKAELARITDAMNIQVRILKALLCIPRPNLSVCPCFRWTTL